MAPYDRGPHDNLAPWIVHHRHARDRVDSLVDLCTGAPGHARGRCRFLVSTSATRGAVFMRVERDPGYVDVECSATAPVARFCACALRPRARASTAATAGQAHGGDPTT